MKEYTPGDWWLFFFIIILLTEGLVYVLRDLMRGFYELFS